LKPFNFQAGWGTSELAAIHENRLKKADLQAVSNEVCFLDNSLLASISSPRTFCAGAKNITPCFGDAGYF
jgi:hypothetical protein